jgi:hypothetical protein
MRKLLFGLMATLIATSSFMGLAPQLSASSHREAPMIADDPTADVTDLYAFRSYDYSVPKSSPQVHDTVTIIANWIPFEDPAGGPNWYKFSESARYNIKIDNDNDARADITYSFTFRNHIRNRDTFLYNTGPITTLDDPDYNEFQTYDAIRYRRQTRVGSGGSSYQVLGRGLIVPPANIGPKSTPDYESLAEQAIYSVGGMNSTRRIFVGPRDDPFFVDLGATFDLLTIRPGAPGNMGGGVDDLAGYNVHTIAIQVPISDLTRDGSVPTSVNDARAVIGVWATTDREDMSVLGSTKSETTDLNLAPDAVEQNYQQVARLGNPLINEVVIPLGRKDEWNRDDPNAEGDYMSYYLNPEVGRLLNALYGLEVPATPRNDLALVLLTGVPRNVIPGFNTYTGATPADMLRLNLAIAPALQPHPMGVLGGDLAGFPNGRRLTDDVVDIELQAIAGGVLAALGAFPAVLPLGDGVTMNDVEFRGTFPYLASPHQGFEHHHGDVEPTFTPGATATGGATMTPSATMTGTMTVEPTATMTGTMTVEPTSTMTGTMTVEPTATMTGTMTVEPTSTMTGTATVEPTVTITATRTLR